MKRALLIAAAVAAATAATFCSAEVPAEVPAGSEPASPVPVYLAEVRNLNDFSLFANGGWDGNWYVGFNTCWVSKLPPAPPGAYQRAYIGAKLGRMKTESVPGRPPWEKRPIEGEIQIAVAGEAVWPQSRRFQLTETAFIPLEGDAENAVEGVGEARWFWAEVPVKFISTDKDNYVALFSPTPALADVRHAPVLAAGWGDTQQNTWLNSSVKGEPPLTREDALKTAVTYFEPAIAIKLVPAGGEPPLVSLKDPHAGTVVLEDKTLLSATIRATDLESAWVEFSTDTRHWRQAGLPRAGAPFDFTLKRADLPVGDSLVRVAASDALGNKGWSGAVAVQVPPPPPPKKKGR